MARSKLAQEASPPHALTGERLPLKLSEEQCRTILKYAELPARLADLLLQRHDESGVQLAPDDLDELLDLVDAAVFRAKGNEKQKVLRIVQKLAGELGSEFTPADCPGRRSTKQAPTIFQIKMTLRSIEPPIWRRIQTQDCTLVELHGLIQVTMGWEFEHLYRFNIGGVEYEDLEMTNDGEAEDAFDTRLSEVLPTKNRRPRFSYEYDFGDDWMHQLIVEERFPPKEGVKYPICLAGQRACPPEDCGGPWGYLDLVEALTDADHDRHDELLEWVGEDFDPERFDLKALNNELRRMRTAKR